MTTNDKIVEVFQSNDYLRERIDPQPKDYFYLSLSDLLLALNQLKTDEPVKILDYGSGGSPYKHLFPNADYLRADYLVGENNSLDYILNEDSQVDEEDASFEFVLSTQVVEHVRNPQAYFSECHRLLKPGGKLICSTHGYFPDHGCPFDFQRWTAEGLTRDLTLAGFEIENVYKLTTGARALFSTLDFTLHSLNFPRSTIIGISTFILTKFFAFFRAGIYRQLDKLRENERVVLDKNNEHSFYIGLFAVAVKK